LKTKFGWQTNDWKLREKANKETCIFLQQDGEKVSPHGLSKLSRHTNMETGDLKGIPPTKSIQHSNT
jgi:hypothetical protein